MTDTIFHSFHDTTFHVFRYGRSYLHAATLDRTGAILPPQDFKGAWHHAWDSEYHEGEAARGFDAEEALANIESDGFHLFNFHPRIEIARCEAANLPGGVDTTSLRRLLKPVDLLILELKNALEHYNDDEKVPQVRAENGALLKKAEAMTHCLDQIVS